MTVTDVRKDPDALTMTIVAEFAASPQRLWQLWADPRQLEQWWGPPGFPATVTSHDLAPGGRVEYHMAAPEGDPMHAFFDVVEATPPSRLRLREGFAEGGDGPPGFDLPPNEIRVTLEATADGRTQMSIETTFASREAMEGYLAIGMDEGMTASVGQIDALLARET